MEGAYFLLILGVIVTIFWLYFIEDKYSALTTVIVTIIAATIVGCLSNRHKHDVVSTTACINVDSTLQQKLLNTVDNQIKEQESFEDLYNKQRPTSAYADAIDYYDLYEIRDMVRNTTNPDSLIQLGNLLFDTVHRLDNETKELFEHDGIKM